ncbi:hypothetical protein [Geodermatophilus sp. URMC 62]|uniref:hypothetical protein n=1 Tax=Geodermatophilus sp. URMC 62 TaxID=3423414 RepID=UPI00406C619E
MSVFHLPSPSHEPTLDERMERLADTVETHGQALRRIERGILLLLDDAATIRARIDAAARERREEERHEELLQRLTALDRAVFRAEDAATWAGMNATEEGKQTRANVEEAAEAVRGWIAEVLDVVDPLDGGPNDDEHGPLTLV